MSKQFTISNDACGNVSVRSGWVISKGIPDIRVGPANGGMLGKAVAGDSPALEAGGQTYLGGSGRNKLVYDLMQINPLAGIWRHGYRNKWHLGKFTLHMILGTGFDSNITDGIDLVARYDFNSPVGQPKLLSTPYGEALLGSSFTLGVDPENWGPVTALSADMVTTASNLPPMLFQSTTGYDYGAVPDLRFGIDIAETGEAIMYFTPDLNFPNIREAIAIRADGPNDSPEGEYISTAGGLPWNPAEPPDDDDAEDTFVEFPSNPFGILTIVYSWPAVPHLDTTTVFLGGKVGFGNGYSAPHMSHSGDNTSPSGSETVIIDLAAAFTAGAIYETADVTCQADWYPVGAFGAATLNVTYSRPGFTPITTTIQPGNFRPAQTTVAQLRINADGTLIRHYEPWTAVVTRRRLPPPAGVVYIEEHSSGGVLSSVQGPRFSPTRPADTATEYVIPLATSDGLGGVEQIWSGPILRR